MAASDIDRVILSFCDTRWLKVARIIGQTYDVWSGAAFQFLPVRPNAWTRVWRFCPQQKTGSQGKHQKRWGVSEVRLAGGPTKKTKTVDAAV